MTRPPLTAAQQLERMVSETEFQGQVTQLADLLGWEWVHFRPAQTSRGWRTPVSGPLGKGWVDLVLVRARDRRLIFAELKRELAAERPDQTRVLGVLGQLAAQVGDFRAADGCQGYTRVEVHVWRPSQLDQIAEVLR